MLFAPGRQVARRIVSRDLEIVRAVRDLVERERIGLHINFRHILVSGRVTDLVPSHAFVVPRLVPCQNRAGRRPFAVDDLDLIRGFGVERTESITIGNIAEHGCLVFAFDHEVERIISARRFLVHDPFPAVFSRGRFDYDKLLSLISGVLSRAVDGELNVRRTGQVAERVADRRAPGVRADRDRCDDRFRQAFFHGENAELGVLVAIGVQSPFAGSGIVHCDGDEISAGQFAHDLHVFIGAGRNRSLRVFHPVATQRDRGAAAVQFELEQTQPGIVDGDGLARRRLGSASQRCRDGFALGQNAPQIFRAVGEVVAAEQIAGAEEFDIAVERASDAYVVHVFEDIDDRPCHQIFLSKVGEGIHGHSHAGQRPPFVLALVRQGHRTFAGNGETAVRSIERTGDLDVLPHHVIVSFEGEIPVVDMEFAVS